MKNPKSLQTQANACILDSKQGFNKDSSTVTLLDVWSPFAK